MDIYIDDNYNAVVSMNNTQSKVLGTKVEIVGGRGGISMGGGYYEEPMTLGETGASLGSGLLSNWFFVGGVTGGVFVVSILLGIIMGKKRIKKGIDIYEN